MSEILNQYSESTKHTFSFIFVALILIVVSLFIPAINQSTIRFVGFKLLIIAALGYAIYIVVSNTLPIIKTENTKLLASAYTGVKKNMIYNSILVMFLVILIWHVCTMNV